MKIYILLFLLISLNVEAALFGFCLKDGQSLSESITYLNQIKSPKDQLFKRASVNCLEVKGNPAMFDLYRRFLSKRFRVLRSYKGNDLGISNKKFHQGMCKVQVIKTGKNKLKKDIIELGRKNNLKREESKSISNSVSNLILTFGKPGSIRVDKEMINITCTKTGRGYQMKFELTSNNSSLSSNAFVTRGSRINLGNILNDLNSKQRALSISKGITLSKSTGSEKFDYFLEVK